jgi:hypothetical protein
MQNGDMQTLRFFFPCGQVSRSQKPPIGVIDKGVASIPKLLKGRIWGSSIDCLACVCVEIGHTSSTLSSFLETGPGKGSHGLMNCQLLHEYPEVDETRGIILGKTWR